MLLEQMLLHQTLDVQTLEQIFVQLGLNETDAFKSSSILIY